MKEDIAAGETRRKRRDVAHVAGYEIDLLVWTDTQSFLFRPDQSTHFVSLIEKCVHEITAEQTGCPSDESAHSLDPNKQAGI